MEAARLLSHAKFARGQYQIVVQEVVVKEQLFLRCARVQVLFHINSDIEARAMIENRDFQCLQCVSDVPVSCLLKTLVCKASCKNMQVKRKNGEPKRSSKVGVRKPLSCY